MNGNRLGMEITYLHSAHHFGRARYCGPYFVGGLGATLFNPDQGYSELYPSLNVGFWLRSAADEARRAGRAAGATLVNSSSYLFCSGGCVVSIRADDVSQGEVMLGLAARF
jgi:hypothetical protein